MNPNWLLLYYNRTIDAFGTGFERVFRLCKDIKYQYSNNQFGFTFEFLRDHFDTENDLINDSIKGLSDAEKELLRLILTGKRYTRQAFADAIGKSPATVQRYLKHMTELGLIRRDGSNKVGQWVAVK